MVPSLQINLEFSHLYPNVEPNQLFLTLKAIGSRLAILVADGPASTPAEKFLNAYKCSAGMGFWKEGLLLLFRSLDMLLTRPWLSGVVEADFAMEIVFSHLQC